MRGILDDPAARGLPAAGLASLQSLQAAARRIEQEVASLAPPGREVLGDARTALQSLPGAAREVGAAAVQAQATVRGADETLQRIGRAADELGQGAAALRGLAAPDSNTRKSLHQTADEIQRAARAVRELAQQLQQRPQSLIWGPGPERTER
jgi:paraquat-inducible protein B